MTVFTTAVYAALQKIPRGKVMTYESLAAFIGHPHAARAVGNALNANPHPITVPCHRVVRSTGDIGGYALGTKKKIALLKKEKVMFHGDHVDLSSSLWQPKHIRKK